MELGSKHLLNLILNGSTSGVEAFIEELDKAIVNQSNILNTQDKIIRALESSGFKHSNQYKDLTTANDESKIVTDFLITLRERASRALKELRE